MDHCKVYLFLTSINIVFTDKYFKLLHEHLTCVCVHTGTAAIYPRHTVCPFLKFCVGNSICIVDSL